MSWPKTVPAALCWALSAVTSAVIDERNEPISVRDSSTRLMPRCLSSTSALTMFTSSSSAFCSSPAAKTAVSTLVSLSATSPRYSKRHFFRPPGCKPGEQQAQAIGDVQIAAQRRERFRIERGDVHRVANRAGRQISDEQLDRLDRDLRLGFFGARAKVRRADDARHAEQRAVGAGLGGEDVERHAAELAGFQPFDQRRFVVDAAAGAIDQPHARPHRLRSAPCSTRLRVSSVSGVWTVR